MALPFDLGHARDLLSRLIEIPSPSGHEKPVCDFIADYVERLGFRVERQEVYKTGYNVVVKVGGGGDVLFCGHVDVVPEFDFVDAFRAKFVDDLVYGRGACDMKGGVTAMLLLLEKIASQKTEPDVSFAFVVDEEMHGRGAAELVLRGIKSEVCIITEPTQNSVCVGNAGCAEFRLTFHGQSGHGGSRAGGNSIRHFVDFYKVFEQKLLLGLDFTEGELPMSPIVNLGRVEGGYGAWIIPPKTYCDVLVHFHPEIRFADAVDRIKRTMDEVAREVGVRVDLTLLHGCDGFLLNNNFYAELLTKAYAETTGKTPKKAIIEAETDANALYHKGSQRCLIFGPGNLRYAHSSIEHVSVGEVV
ncbi:MAG: M20/M25/M40 family metallo-hydrolase, partial [Candidatus Caldarchaeum sp.]|nr:M20/M25/M40 family metallo-hydrolase [Candidatus Caldarchaeum sp.]